MQKGDGKLLNDKMRESLYTCIAKGFFVAKIIHPDIHPTIIVLPKRVREPNVKDLEKLIRLCRYINSTENLQLMLGINNLKVVKWYIDA